MEISKEQESLKRKHAAGTHSVLEKRPRTSKIAACILEDAKKGKIDIETIHSAIINNCIHATDEDKFQLIHFLAIHDRPDLLKVLLDNNVDVNAKTSSGLAPIHLAARDGHNEILQSLLMNNAQINTIDNKGRQPIHVAAENGRTATINLLLEHHGDIGAQTRKGRDPIHCAAHTGRTVVLQTLIEHNADIHASDRDGLQPIHIASQKGFIDTMKLLLGANAEVNSKDRRQQQPLHHASCKGWIDAAKYLLSCNGSIAARDIIGYQPIHYACEKGNIEMLKLLLNSRADINAKTRFGLRPMHVAARSGQTSVMRFLVEQGSSLHNEADNVHHPIHSAAYTGQTEALRFLAEQGVDVNTKSIANLYPVQITARNGHIEALHYLLSLGISTPLLNELMNIAAKKGNCDTLHLLLEYGANINAQNKKGLQPIHTASKWENVDTISYLLQNGADLHAITRKGEHAIHIAAGKGCSKTVQFLIDNGASPDELTEMNSATPLHFAVEGRAPTIKTVETLLDNGADFNARCFSHRKGYPLEIAAQFGNFKVLILLLSCGALLEHIDKDIGYVVKHLLSAEFLPSPYTLKSHTFEIQPTDVLKIASGQGMIDRVIQSLNLMHDPLKPAAGSHYIQAFVGAATAGQANVIKTLYDYMRNNPFLKPLLRHTVSHGIKRAAAYKHHNVISYLLAHGSEVLKDEDFAEALIPAAASGSTSITRTIHNRISSDTPLLQPSLALALAQAVMHPHLSTVEYLITLSNPHVPLAKAGRALSRLLSSKRYHPDGLRMYKQLLYVLSQRQQILSHVWPSITRTHIDQLSSKRLVNEPRALPNQVRPSAGINSLPAEILEYILVIITQLYWQEFLLSTNPLLQARYTYKYRY